MKVIRKNVYYCGFCKKRGLSPYAMKKHEKHCTNNLDRQCRMCENGGDYREIIEEFKSRYKVKITKHAMFESSSIEWIGKTITLEEIQTLVDNCPACTLTILRHLDNIVTQEIFYDYKEDCDRFFKERNRQENLYDIGWH